MKRTLIALALTLTFLPTHSSAATLAELQAQVQALMAQIATLQSQSATPAPPQSGAASCPNLTRNLFRGSRGNDVAQLQQFLVSQKLLASDSATGFFGAMTESAVKQFQCSKMSICSGSLNTNGYGAVGPRTRALVIASCSSAPQTPLITLATPPIVTTITPTVTTSVSSASYFWQTSGWGACINSVQFRTVSCMNSSNATASDIFCTATKPAASQSCTITTTPQNQSCSFNNQTVLHGASVSAYQSSNVPYGSLCASQTRTCSNGTLSGSFSSSTCSAATGGAPPTTVPGVLVGFWGAALADDYGGNYIQAASTHANIAMFDQKNGSYVSRVDQASAAGVKSVLMLTWILFSDGRTLLPDYRARFDAVWNELGQRQNDVVGFYLTDEPYWNNQGAGASAISDSQLKANLSAAAEYIHQKAPGRPVMLTDGWPVISRSDLASMYPEAIDYVGMNCYLAFGDPCSEANVSTLVSKLSAALKTNQKLIVTADGYWPTTPSAEADANLRARIVFWENLLAPYFASGRVGAFTPFIYQSVPNDPGGVHGIIESQQALAELNRYMDSVRNGNPNPLTAISLTIGKTAQASHTYESNVPSKAIDGNPGTVWNSGGMSPQWIQIDLGAPHTIQQIRLTVEQSPEGQTTHSVYGSVSGADGSWQLIKTFQGSTVALQVLDYVLPQSITNIKYIRVETALSPSWVAWREIDIKGF